MADDMDLDPVGGIGMERDCPGGEIFTEGSSTFRDCICDILSSVTRLSKELNFGEEVLKIEANPTNINVSTLHATDVLASLQKHIGTLQSISANLKLLVKPVSEEIKASKTEIDRRISAFIERKQMEINENNVREFCNVIDCNQENSCARTDAVFTPFPGFKSHVKVTRVVNRYGPQTWVGGHRDHAALKHGVTPCGNPAVEERIQNIEAHLNLTANRPVPQDIYQRLKCMEDRILKLEGLSPEYFEATGNLHKRTKATPSQGYSLTELDMKISALKAALLKKVSETDPRDPEHLPF
ncbi:hypothetical protein GJAV_G00107710 [Gymnothorax javanicus]|nr:hypothetical protein GJAV_G00107710 [Gymnothorax javanicus]